MRPKEGRYKFLSLNKSSRGKKLLVGEIVMRNHRNEKTATGEIRRKFLKITNVMTSQMARGMKLEKTRGARVAQKS